LELSHLVEQHDVAEMKVRRRRIKAGFHSERAAAGNPFGEIAFVNDLVRAAAQFLDSPVSC
jgi:hypothetical protein